jgi:hypothetical protein
MTRQTVVFGAGLLIGAGLMLLPPLASRAHTKTNTEHSTNDSAESAIQATHTQRTFEFTVKLPMKAAAPLFGANKERAWAPGWNPAFLWPANAKDQPGMVFTITRGGKTAVWFAPRYDLTTGSIQYAYVIPDVMATLITIELTPEDNWTHVAVRYERTALQANARDLVLEMADQDGKSGPEWERQISDYLGTLPR